MGERTWDGALSERRANGSTISAHPSQQHRPDPNDDADPVAIRYWIQYADFYQLPNITYYDSVDHLARILRGASAARLRDISRAMAAHNERIKTELVAQWTQILRRIADHSPNTPH